MSRQPYSGWFAPSKPRQVSGGLRAKSTRGKIATTWWSTRFIEMIESMGMGGRLTRGRNYARRGQVLSLDLAPGVVNAQVQGSRARPYRVRIGIAAYGKSDWARIGERLSDDAWFVAQLLAGQMPPDIEGVFSELGLELFPSADLVLDCSCPDWEVPCKHLAAVLYLVAERLDEDPFRLLAWRGRGRDDLLSHLQALSHQDEGGPELPADPSEFYRLRDAITTSRPAPSEMDLLERLPELRLKVRGHHLAEVLRPAYAGFGDEVPSPSPWQ